MLRLAKIVLASMVALAALPQTAGAQERDIKFTLDFIALGRALEIALADDPGKDLTAADVRAALGQIKDETFNGLTPPVSFTEDGVQEQSECAFSIRRRLACPSRR